MLFVQVRTERSIEFYQIMLLNIEYDMSLSRPHSKIMLFFTTATIFLKETSIYLYFCFFLKKQLTMYHIFVKLCMWSFSWNLIPSTNMPKVHILQWWKSKMQTDYAIIEVHFVHQWKNVLCENYIMSWLSKVIIDVKYKVGWMVVKECYFL